MKSIRGKTELKPLLDESLQVYQSGGTATCVRFIGEQILSCKIKFPVLEYAAAFFYQHIGESEQLPFCDQIQQLNTIGGNVLSGILLQKRLPLHFEASIAKAALYIAQADAWYVCDIIGERVFGYSLLQQPEKTLDKLWELSRHPSPWVGRSLGAGIHYAIKKGLDKEMVRKAFQLLLAMAQSKNKEIKQGAGWAAKTTAKFHPEIIEEFTKEIHQQEKVASWFRAKIEIGLKRYDAKRNKS